MDNIYSENISISEVFNKNSYKIWLKNNEFLKEFKRITTEFSKESEIAKKENNMEYYEL